MKKIYLLVLILAMVITLLPLVSCKAEQSLTLLSPTGGEEWVLGKTYDITWKAQRVDKVHIYLWFPDGATGLLAKDVPATSGKYSVKLEENQRFPNIPRSLAAGLYKILITTGEMELGVRDNSGDFTIVGKQAIEVFGPVTVEVLEAPAVGAPKGATYVWTYRTINGSNGPVEMIYDIIYPTERGMWSGAVVLDPDGKEPEKEFYYTLGQKALLKAGGEHILYLSLAFPEGFDPNELQLTFGIYYGPQG